MQDIDVSKLRDILQLMKVFHVPELQIGELHVSMPSAAVESSIVSGDAPFRVDEDGNVQVTDPALYSAVPG